jgi:hypothetical protein
MCAAQAAVIAGYYGMLTSEPFPAAAAQTVFGGRADGMTLPTGKYEILRGFVPQPPPLPNQPLAALAEGAPQKLPDQVVTTSPNPQDEQVLTPVTVVDGPILITPPIHVPIAPAASTALSGLPSLPPGLSPVVPNQASGLTLVSNQEPPVPQPPLPIGPAGFPAGKFDSHPPTIATPVFPGQSGFIMPPTNDPLPPPPVPVGSTPLYPLVNGGMPASKPKVNPATATLCPWSLNVKIVEGRTLLTAQDGPEIKFTIQCDRLTVQTAGGLIQAGGKVMLKARSLEGNCDGLIINWNEDAVTLVNAHLKCKLDGQEADFQAQEMRLQLMHIQAKPLADEGSK